MIMVLQPMDGTPAIPPRVRTVAYFVGLAVGGLTILATGVTAAVAPDAAVTVLAVCGAFSGAASFILGGLGVAFRPTAVTTGPGIAPPPWEIADLTPAEQDELRLRHGGLGG